jgi:hypothetical protein
MKKPFYHHSAEAVAVSRTNQQVWPAAALAVTQQFGRCRRKSGHSWRLLEVSLLTHDVTSPP